MALGTSSEPKTARRHAAARRPGLSDDDHGACMVKRSGIVSLGGLGLKGHGLSVEFDLLGHSARVRRAAPRLQTQSVGPVVASYGAAKTASQPRSPRFASTRCEHPPPAGDL